MTVESTPETPAIEPEAVVIETPEVEAPKVETATEEQLESDVKEGETAEVKDDAPEPPASEKRGVQKRIAELTWKAHEAERQAEHWRRVATENAQNAAEPSAEAFDDPASYARAIARWEAVQAVTTQQAATAEAAATMARDDAWMARQADFAAQTPDYERVVGQSKLDIAPHVGQAIIESENGPALAYKLATNPDLAARLNGLSPNRALIEIGRIEATLTTVAPPPVKALTKAPPPPSPISGTSATRVNLANADMDTYMAERRKQGARF